MHLNVEKLQNQVLQKFVSRLSHECVFTSDFYTMKKSTLGGECVFGLQNIGFLKYWIIFNRICEIKAITVGAVRLKVLAQTECSIEAALSLSHHGGTLISVCV